MSQLIVGVGVLVVAVGGFVVSFRAKFSPVQTLIRRVNRRYLNPRQLALAGRPGSWASIVRHVGRRSGADYRTPVTPIAVDGGFVVPLPYGPTADWVRNVLAAGGATLDHQGEEVAVTEPEVLGEEANAWFSPSEQRQHRLFGVSDFLFLRRG